jgi:hypothetical protein
MNSVFGAYMRKFVLIFMDDILIYSRSIEDHAQHLSLVFQVSREHQLFIKFKKCSFGQNQIDYLGHIISDQGVSTDPAKISIMLQWLVPKNFTDVRGFLGLTGYYRKFVKNYAIMAKPLTVLLQHKQFVWTEVTQRAFDTLKQAGHLVAFFNKALSIANQKLSTYEKEFLVVLMAVEKWRPYLSRQPFLIMTDHKSLYHLQDQSLSTEMQRKAMAKLAGLQFKLQCKKGVENKAADALSRIGHNFLVQSTSTALPLWIQEVINTYAVDTEAQQLLQELALVSPAQGYELSQGLIRYNKKRIWVGANSAVQTKIINAFHCSAMGDIQE